MPGIWRLKHRFCGLCVNFNFYHVYSIISAGSILFLRSAIRTDDAFSVIREINEVLSLSNEPDKLVNTVLDTFAQVTNIECCWIQTIRDRQQQLLSLAAHRGFTPGMQAEIAAMSLQHNFPGQVIGMGLVAGSGDLLILTS